MTLSPPEIDTMLIHLIAASLAVATVNDDADAASYPELAPAALLPAIISDLKRTLPDPHSIRDFVICPAHGVHVKDGKPDRWYVTFAFNARNEQGGYAGLAPYTVGFKGGRITLHAFSSKISHADALDSLINRTAINRVLKCQPVPDATIQTLLSAPFGD